jgi:hypothetical protein
MKRIVGFWMQSDKLVPNDFALTVYKEYFENLDTTERKPSPEPSAVESPGPVMKVISPQLVPDVLPTLNDFNPISSGIALPTLAGLGSLGLGSLGTSASSILSALRHSQSVSIGLPTAPASLANLLPSTPSAKQYHSNPYPQSDPRAGNGNISPRSMNPMSSDPRNAFNSYPPSNYGDPRGGHDPRGGYDARGGNDLRNNNGHDERSGHSRQSNEFGGSRNSDHRGPDPRSRDGNIHPDRADRHVDISRGPVNSHPRTPSVPPGPDSEPSHPDTSVPDDCIKSMIS